MKRCLNGRLNRWLVNLGLGCGAGVTTICMSSRWECLGLGCGGGMLVVAMNGLFIGDECEKVCGA